MTETHKQKIEFKAETKKLLDILFTHFIQAKIFSCVN